MSSDDKSDYFTQVSLDIVVISPSSASLLIVEQLGAWICHFGVRLSLATSPRADIGSGKSGNGQLILFLFVELRL